MTADAHRFTLSFAPDHPAFAGHFPGNPIVPGVQLLDRAQRVIEAQCGLCISGIQAAKFLSPASPGDMLELEYETTTSLARFEIRCGARKVASGQFLLDGTTSP